MTDIAKNKKYNELRILGYKTYEELDKELSKGLRESITHEEIMKSQELKRALYPDWIIYPKDNYIYEAMENVEIPYVTYWGAPFTGGGNAMFPKGERVKVSTPNSQEPTSVYCDAINYKKLHGIIVPEKDRTASDYCGYYFCIDTVTLNTKFKLISTTETKQMFFKTRLYFTAAITIAIWSLLIWDHFHGGVPTHHILQREDLPGFSNWWGGILLPLLTWFLLYQIQKRIGDDSQASKFSLNILYAFIGALFFGILLSVFFTFGNTEMPFYMLVGLIILALFLPIYRAEYFLGFVIGMIFTFGGVLPIGIVSILTLIGAIVYLLIRPVIRFVVSRLAYLVSSKKP